MDTPHLHIWYDSNAEQAAECYCKIIPRTSIIEISRYRGEAAEQASGKADGAAMAVSMDIAGLPVTLINGGPDFPLSAVVSLQLPCESQDEIDTLWNALIADGGGAGRCGWLTDRFGMSWQIVPCEMGKLLSVDDPDAALRVTKAFLKMKKLDIAVLQAAAKGG